MYRISFIHCLFYVLLVAVVRSHPTRSFSPQSEKKPCVCVFCATFFLFQFALLLLMKRKQTDRIHTQLVYIYAH